MSSSELPLVSVLIPCFNAAPFIEQAIESALHQSWSNTEIIVVDDGSTDGSAERVEQFADRGVLLFKQENTGASAARNRAFRESQGEYIQYLDADDVLDSQKIENQLIVHLEQAPENILTSCRWGSFLTDAQQAFFHESALWTNQDAASFLVNAWKEDVMMPPACWLVPRDLIIATGNWDESLSLNDDGEFFSRMLRHNPAVRFCNRAIAFYRTGHGGKLSARSDRVAWESLLRSSVLSARYLLELEDSERTRSAAAHLFQRFIYKVYPDAPDLRTVAEQKVSDLGGCDLRAPGGKKFQLLCSIIGWKMATRLRRMLISS